VTEPPRILVAGPSSADTPDVSLGETPFSDAEIVHESAVETVIERLQHEPFDAIYWSDSETMYTVCENNEGATEQYRTLLAALPVPVLVVDREHIVQYANDEALAVTQAETDDQIRGRSLLSFLPEESHEISRERLEQVFETGEATEKRKFEVENLAGGTGYIESRIIPTTYNGEPAAQVVLTDVTTQQIREQRLERQRKQITRLHDVGVELAACETQTAVYELVVSAAEDILDLDTCLVDSVVDGRLRTEATSTKLEEYQEPPIESEEAGLAGKAYRNDTTYLIDRVSDHPDANPTDEYLSGLTVPITDHGVFQAASHESESFSETDLELVEVLCGHAREALTRIEQQQQLRDQRDQLKRENERLDEFASIVSHDLRNPLSVAKLRLDLIETEYESEHIAPAAGALEQMELLIDDLLTLARNGETVSAMEPVTVSRLVERAWELAETGAATLEIADSSTIRADKQRLHQLLGNLLRNAIEHNSDRTAALTVRVGTLNSTDRTGIYVADNGTGIPEPVRESLFEPGVSTNDSGTGLGLAIVSRIAEAHGWDITVTESADGGARFEITGIELLEHG